MADATSLMPPSPGLSATLLRRDSCKLLEIHKNRSYFSIVIDYSDLSIQLPMF